MPLDDADLAYMREVQDDHRPTPAVVTSRTETPDGMGGVTTGEGTEAPVTIRVQTRDKIPSAIQAEYGANVVGITMDLVDVRAGDRVVVTADVEEYEVVSEGDPSEWATAQRVWAVRKVWP